MALTAYPTSAEVSARLTAEGINVPANVGYITEAAISRFESLTGYIPFLGDAAPTSWTYDPPLNTPFMSLDGGFWDVDSIVVDGTTFTLNDDYILLPLNAAGRGRGWDAVEFRKHPGTERISVVVTGKRGYAEELPYDAYEAIMSLAIAMSVAPSLQGTFGAFSRIKQGSVEVEGGNAEESSKASMYAKQFMSVVTKYKRIDP
jgi:hypothetical protein